MTNKKHLLAFDSFRLIAGQMNDAITCQKQVMKKKKLSDARTGTSEHTSHLVRAGDVGTFKR